MPNDAVMAYCAMRSGQGNDRGLVLCARRDRGKSMQGYLIPRRISLARSIGNRWRN